MNLEKLIPPTNEGDMLILVEILASMRTEDAIAFMESSPKVWKTYFDRQYTLNYNVETSYNHYVRYREDFCVYIAGMGMDVWFCECGIIHGRKTVDQYGNEISGNSF